MTGITAAICTGAVGTLSMINLSDLDPTCESISLREDIFSTITSVSTPDFAVILESGTLTCSL